jgi:hypothetical protein
MMMPQTSASPNFSFSGAGSSGRGRRALRTLTRCLLGEPRIAAVGRPRFVGRTSFDFRPKNWLRFAIFGPASGAKSAVQMPIIDAAISGNRHRPIAGNVGGS